MYYTDEQTEIFTKNGWISIKNLSDDKCIFIDHDGYNFWDNAYTKNSYYEGQINNLNLEGVKLFFTQNSNLFYNYRNSKNNFVTWDVRPLNKDGQIKIKCSSYSRNEGCALQDHQIALAAWLMTDGCFYLQKHKYPSWNIYQSKNSSKIEEILIKNNLPFSFYQRQRNIKEICGKKLKSTPKPEKRWKFNTKTTSQILTWVPSNIKTDICE